MMKNILAMILHKLLVKYCESYEDIVVVIAFLVIIDLNVCVYQIYKLNGISLK
ncbi:hypothetical protein [Clostridium sp. BL-8]|uniref:hypothetical protein n=1 Tax=Clostridium sp. BL-8 TaxID=349938 RepID=UPI0015C2F28B|nr:hypothetical protein [Clostridium sp. BL-8]